jgi:GSH-dependent disulfide-bond oxidoreductase
MIDLYFWPTPNEAQGIDLSAVPNVARWYDALKQRPGLRRGYDVGREQRAIVASGPDAESRKHLFGAKDAR